MPTNSKLGGDRYLLVIDDKGDAKKSKDIITTMAKTYYTYYKIPSGTGGRCYSTRKRDRKGGEFLELQANSFANCTENDKLYICGHGNATECGDRNAAGVAKLLNDGGLKRIGLVTFKSCSVGSKDFLDKFVSSCSKSGVQLGFAKGYTNILHASSTKDTGKPNSYIGKHKHKSEADLKQGSDKKNNARYKIVEGPLANNFKWGRFQTTVHYQAEIQKAKDEANRRYFDRGEVLEVMIIDDDPFTIK